MSVQQQTISQIVPKKSKPLSTTQISFLRAKISNSKVSETLRRVSEMTLVRKVTIMNKRTRQSTQNIINECLYEEESTIQNLQNKMSSILKISNSESSYELESERVSDSSSSDIDSDYDDILEENQDKDLASKSIAPCQQYINDNQEAKQVEAQQEFQLMVNQCKQIEASTPEELIERSVFLGPQTHKKTIIFDLDETLISAKTSLILLNNYEAQDDSQQPTSKFELMDIILDYNDNFLLNIKATIRPHVDEVLSYLSKEYELGIFTAAQQEYCDTILEQIDPLGEYFSFRLYRQHCIQRGKSYIKDLSIIKDRNLSDMALIDNSVISFAFQLSNGVPISSFYAAPDQENDDELISTVNYVKEGLMTEDFREYNQNLLTSMRQTGVTTQETPIQE